MRRHSTYLLGAVAGTVSLLLAGCGGGGSSSGTTTITFWNSFTASDRPAVEALVEKFNTSQSKVHISMSIQPADVLAQKLLPAYAASKGPTITTLDASQLPEYADKGVFAPVDDVYGKGGLDSSTLPAASLKATTYDGKQYGVPFSAAGTMLYYNKTLFQQAGISKPPSTMDELVSDAKKTTKYHAGNDNKSQYGFIIPDHAAPATWATLLASHGGSVVAGDDKKATFGDQQTIAAMTYWANLVRTDHISPVGLAGSDTDTLFSAGRAAMYINGPWASTGFKQAGIDFGVVPVPRGPDGQTCTAISVNMHLNARASSDEQTAAKKFFTFWNSRSTQVYWATHSAYPPNLNTIPTSALKANPVAATFTKAAGAKFYLAGLTQATEIDNNVVIPTIQQITNGRGSAAQLLPAAAKKIDSLLNDQ